MTATPEELHPDGLAMSTFSSGGGLLGVVRGYLGPEEEQGRGSRHAHLSVWLARHPFARVLEDAENLTDPEKLEERIAKWGKACMGAVASRQFSCVHEAASTIGVAIPPRTDESDHLGEEPGVASGTRVARKDGDACPDCFDAECKCDVLNRGPRLELELLTVKRLPYTATKPDFRQSVQGKRIGVHKNR